jgi:multicomponent Na+:H+ antiporter subunit E
MAFTTSLDVAELVAGVFISFIISLLTYKFFTNTGFSILSPIKIFYFIKYVFVFIFELIKANFDVARIVINPKLPINPGIVEVESKLTSDFAKMILANSITLTPGTLTVDIIDNKLFVHWLYVKGTDTKTTYNEIAKTFEDILIKIYE